MDNTKLNVIMCKMAIEIQSSKVPIWGFCNFEVGDVFLKADKPFIFDGEKRQPRIKDVIWLPTEPQYQDMLKGKYDFINMFVIFTDWARGTLAGDSGRRYKRSEFDNFYSWEQLWRGFIMSELYNKIWNGKDWVKNGI